MPDLSPEAAKVLAARKAAVEELKILDGQERPLNDHLVQRLASARLYAEAVTLRMLNGENITASEFKAADDMIEAARAVAAHAMPLEVKLVIVERSADELTDEQGKPLKPRRTTPKLLPPPVTIDAEVVQASNEVTPDVRAPNAAPVQPPRRDPGSIHDFPGARMAPGTLAQLAQQGGLNGTAYNPLEKAPDWDAKHRVPEQFWPGPFGS